MQQSPLGAVFGVGIFSLLFTLYLPFTVGALAISVLLIWSVVLFELIFLDIPEGKIRTIIANMAWNAFSAAVGALTSSAVVGLIVWIIFSIVSAYISFVDDVDGEGFKYA